MTNIQKSTTLISVAASFLITFMGSALNLSVPIIGEEFKINAEAACWIVTIYMLVSASFSLPFGKLADITSKQVIFIIGIFIFTAAAIFAAYSNNLAMLLICRSAQGLGASMVFATNHAILINAFDASDRGKALGYATSATYMGLALGPVLGGILNHHVGWRCIFFINAIIAAALLFAALRSAHAAKQITDRTSQETEACCLTDMANRAFRNDENSISISSATDASMLTTENAHTAAAAIHSADISGCLLYIAAAVSCIYGLTAISNGILPIICIAVGIILAICFIRKERRTAEPLLDINMFLTDRKYTFSNLAAFINYGTTYAISYILSIYYQTVIGCTSQLAGILLTASPVIMALLSPYIGRLSDKISSTKLTCLGMIITTAVLIALSFTAQKQSISATVMLNAVSGFGLAVFSSPNANTVMSCVHEADYASASSILATMRSLGQTFTMAIITTIFSLFLGNITFMQADPSTLLHIMKIQYLTCAALSAIGIFFSLKCR